MDCKQINAVLSDYLDKTLETDISRDVKRHLLECKNCSNAYFTMKSISDELAGLEKIKAPAGFLDSVNHAVESSSWHKNIFRKLFGFRFRFEYLTYGTMALLVFLIVTNLQPLKDDIADRTAHKDRNGTALMSENQYQADTLPVKLDLFMNDRNGTGHGFDDDIVSMAAEKNREQDDISDFLEDIKKEFPVLSREKAVSNINEIISLAGGEILSKDSLTGSSLPETITFRIPFNNYESFIRRIEQIGNLSNPAPSLRENYQEFILLRIQLNFRKQEKNNR